MAPFGLTRLRSLLRREDRQRHAPRLPAGAALLARAGSRHTPFATPATLMTAPGTELP